MSGWFPYAPTVRVEGGIKARSKRGAIGQSWWSGRFIETLESYGMSGRLARGRNYARAGQVLEFELGRGEVTALVQGSMPDPYEVRVGVRPLTEEQWAALTGRLAGQALFRAKLLAGEMPPQIEEVFADCGTPLFPGSAADLDMTCNCPDYSVPCKHLAAVCYVLAEAFDNDPFGMIAWRGMGRDELLSALRGPGEAGQGGAGDDRPDDGARPLIDVAGPPLADCLADFWSPGVSQARLRALPAPSAAPPDLLLRMFEPPPVLVRGKDLLAVLTPAYRRLGDTPPDG